MTPTFNPFNEKTCGFVETKKDKYLNEQTNAVHSHLLHIYHISNFALAVILVSIYIHCKAFMIIFWGGTQNVW